MPVDTTPLTLSAAEDLPGHARTCVFWEVDPVAGAHSPLDAAFEKEAWLSMVMLEWGSCGRIAWNGAGAVGYAVYAPPALVPRANRFPTAPVSTDAILLTQLKSSGGRSAAENAGRDRALFDAVIGDLIRRGVRAVEAFGYRQADAGSPEAAAVDPADLVRAVPDSAGLDCSCMRCMISCESLAAWGFEEVAPHHRFPRFRLELGRDLGWKAEVEAALDSLLAVSAAESTLSGRRPLVTVHDSAAWP